MSPIPGRVISGGLVTQPLLGAHRCCPMRLSIGLRDGRRGGAGLLAGTWRLVCTCPGDTDPPTPQLLILSGAGHAPCAWTPFCRKVLGSSGWQCSYCCCGNPRGKGHSVQQGCSLVGAAPLLDGLSPGPPAPPPACLHDGLSTAAGAGRPRWGLWPPDLQGSLGPRSRWANLQWRLTELTAASSCLFPSPSLPPPPPFPSLPSSSSSSCLLLPFFPFPSLSLPPSPSSLSSPPPSFCPLLRSFLPPWASLSVSLPTVCL